MTGEKEGWKVAARVRWDVWGSLLCIDVLTLLTCHSRIAERNGKQKVRGCLSSVVSVQNEFLFVLQMCVMQRVLLLFVLNRINVHENVITATGR